MTGSRFQMLVVSLLLLPGSGLGSDAWTVRLENALPFTKQKADLIVEIPAQPDGRAWAWTSVAPGQEHPAPVTKVQRRDNILQAQVEFFLSHERTRGSVVLGGEAVFHIELRQEGTTWTGTYRGHTKSSDSPELREKLERAWGWGFNPQDHDFLQPLIRNRLKMALTTAEVAGRATGTLAPSPFAYRSFPTGNDHPRLFFRKADLDELRRRMTTPQGETIMAALRAQLEKAQTHGFGFQPEKAEHMQYGVWAAGHGLMYQLTGDKTHADRAMGLGIGAMYGPYYYGGWWIHPYQIMGMAIAYDLCQDAWPQDYRDMVYAFLFQNIRDLAMRHDESDLLATRRIYGFANDQHNFDVDSPRDFGAIKLRAAAAIAALAIAADRVPVYQPLPLDSVRAVEPAVHYVPWAGVPVVPFTDGQMPSTWLVNGPFQRGLMPDPLVELGGMAKARPEPGMTVTHDGEKLDFRWYLPAGQGDKIRGPRIYPRDCGRFWTSSTGGGYYKGIDLVKRWRAQLGRDPGIEVAIYTVLDNDRERIVQARPNWGWNSFGVRMWLNGVEVRDGDLIRLQPGLYPIMCQVPVMGGYANQGPNLLEYTPEMHAADMAAWEQAQSTFNSTGKGMAEMERNLESLTRSVRRFMSDQIAADGSGGWNDSIHEVLFPMLLACRNVSGNDLATNTGVQEIVTQAVRIGASGDSRSVTPMVTHSLALMPDQYKPVAVWYLDQYGWGLRRPHEAVIVLPNFPRDVTAQHPSTRFQLPGSYAGHGLHLFPCSWDRHGSFLVRLEHGALPMSSAFAFGNISITGFGRDWAPMHAKRYRWEEQFGLNRLAVHDHFHTGGGRVIHSNLLPDGSGVVSIESDQFKRGTVVNNTGGPGQHIVWDNQHQPRAALLRSVAVDYSGASGVPALIVIADRIRGLNANSEKIWRMDLGGASDQLDIDAANRRFTVGLNKKQSAKPTDPTMQGVFVSETALELKAAPYGKDRGVAIVATADRHLSDRERGEQSHNQRLTSKLKNSSRASGNDDATDAIINDFDKTLDHQSRAEQTADMVILAVITLQNGPPPPIQITGNTTATIGKRSIRFDGTKVVIE